VDCLEKLQGAFNQQHKDLIERKNGMVLEQHQSNSSFSMPTFFTIGF